MAKSQTEVAQGEGTDRELGRATLFLAVAAAWTTETSRWSNLYSLGYAGWEFALSLALAVALYWGFRWFKLNGSRRWLGSLVAALAMACLPALFEFLGRGQLSAGQPPETIQLAMLRNVMLAAAFTAGSSGPLRLACVLSLFVVLGGLFLAQALPPYFFSVGYGVIGLWWLMGAHWDQVNTHRVAATRIAMPKRAIGGAMACALAFAAVAGVGVARWERVVHWTGWFWGSGGDSLSDPYASRGEKTGNDVVAATSEVDTIGATESDIFLSSHKPSLYDMFSDMLGEVVKQAKNEQAEAIDYQESAADERKLNEFKGDGGEFSTRRAPQKGRSENAPREDRDSNAVMLVTGRAPVHLRLATYDEFDGTTWKRSDAARKRLERMRRETAVIFPAQRGSKTWFEIATPTGTGLLEKSASGISASGARDVHKISILNLETNRIPSPAAPTALHIDKIKSPGMIAWHDDGCFILPGRTTIPPLQVLHVESRPLAVDALSVAVVNSEARDSSSSIGDSAKRLAIEWTRGLTNQAAQVRAVVENLQRRCRFEPRVRPDSRDGDSRASDPVAPPRMPTDGDDTIEFFLNESHSGPDYMFAGAAVQMLQSLGFEARLVSGFYASDRPDRRIKRQSKVLPEDLHFWAEVLLEDGRWATVDPSPGFASLGPHRTWVNRLRDIATAMAEYVARHPWAMLSAICLLLAVGWNRHWIWDAGALCLWRWRCRKGSRATALATLAILERRFRWSGLPRPRQTTVRSWLRQRLPEDLPETTRSRCLRWIDTATRSLYAVPHVESGDPRGDLEDARTMLRVFDLSAIAQMARSHRKAVKNNAIDRPTDLQPVVEPVSV